MHCALLNPTSLKVQQTMITTKLKTKIVEKASEASSINNA